MKTVQKTFRFVPKLSVVKLIGLSAERRALREPVRKEKSQQVPAMEAPPKCGANLGKKHFDGRHRVVSSYVFSGEGMTIFDTVMVSPFISPVSFTVWPACVCKAERF